MTAVPCEAESRREGLSVSFSFSLSLSLCFAWAFSLSLFLSFSLSLFLSLPAQPAENADLFNLRSRNSDKPDEVSGAKARGIADQAAVRERSRQRQETNGKYDIPITYLHTCRACGAVQVCIFACLLQWNAFTRALWPVCLHA